MVPVWGPWSLQATAGTRLRPSNADLRCSPGAVTLTMSKGGAVDAQADNAESQDPADVLRAVWQGTPGALQDLDAECSPTKACRNMKDVTFDGFAEDGGDIRTAWRNTLAAEGKLGNASLADLVFGESN